LTEGTSPREIEQLRNRLEDNQREFDDFKRDGKQGDKKFCGRVIGIMTLIIVFNVDVN